MDADNRELQDALKGQSRALDDMAAAKEAKEHELAAAKAEAEKLQEMIARLQAEKEASSRTEDAAKDKMQRLMKEFRDRADEKVNPHSASLCDGEIGQRIQMLKGLWRDMRFEKELGESYNIASVSLRGENADENEENADENELSLQVKVKEEQSVKHFKLYLQHVAEYEVAINNVISQLGVMKEEYLVLLEIAKADKEGAQSILAKLDPAATTSTVSNSTTENTVSDSTTTVSPTTPATTTPDNTVSPTTTEPNTESTDNTKPAVNAESTDNTKPAANTVHAAMTELPRWAKWDEGFYLEEKFQTTSLDPDFLLESKQRCLKRKGAAKLNCFKSACDGSNACKGVVFPLSESAELLHFFVDANKVANLENARVATSQHAKFGCYLKPPVQ